MEELVGRNLTEWDDDDRPTLPESKLPEVGPDAITLPGGTEAPFFDVATAAFFAGGEQPSRNTANDVLAPSPDEELAAWWALQRRMAAVRWVTALMALCVLLLATATR